MMGCCVRELSTFTLWLPPSAGAGRPECWQHLASDIQNLLPVSGVAEKEMGFSPQWFVFRE